MSDTHQLFWERGGWSLRALIRAGTAAPAVVLAASAAASAAYVLNVMRPQAAWLDDLLPVDPNDATPLIAALSAVGLAALTAGLMRSKAMAWWLALMTLSVALLAQSDSITHPIYVVVIGVLMAVLIADRRRYEVETGAGWRRIIAGLLIVGGLALGLEISLVVVATGDWPAPIAAAGDMTWAVANSLGLSDDAGARALSQTGRGALLGLLLLAARLPVVLAALGILSRVPEPPPDPMTRSRARAIARRYGSGALLPFQLGDDKCVFSPVDSEGVVVYGMAGRTAVVLGDLIGPREMSPALLALFVEHSRRLDRVPVVYQASQEGIAVLRQAGFRTFKVGEEAVIDLPSFDLAGPRRANLRHTVTRCKRDGVTLRWFPDGLPLAEVHLAEQLEAIDRAWRRHAGPEMGFTISRFERANLTWQPISIAVDRDGRALGFTTYRRTGVDGGWVLDLMRRAPDGPPGVIEACIAEAALAFSHAGSSSLSLGLAPLSGLDQGGGPFEERLLAHLGPLARHWYDVRGLWFFKNKFDPVWLPRYGAALRRRDFVAFAMGLMWVHVGAAVTWPRGRSRRAAAAA